LGSRVVSHDESLHTQYAYQYYNGEGYVHTPLMHGPFLFHATALSYWLLWRQRLYGPHSGGCFGRHSGHHALLFAELVGR
jgi:hypothetical protein